MEEKADSSGWIWGEVECIQRQEDLKTYNKLLTLFLVYNIYFEKPKGDEGLMEFRDGSDKETASHFGQVPEKVRWRPWQ
jgi:hypothetical protein